MFWKETIQKCKIEDWKNHREDSIWIGLWLWMKLLRLVRHRSPRKQQDSTSCWWRKNNRCKYLTSIFTVLLKNKLCIQHVCVCCSFLFVLVEIIVCYFFTLRYFLLWSYLPFMKRKGNLTRRYMTVSRAEKHSVIHQLLISSLHMLCLKLYFELMGHITINSPLSSDLALPKIKQQFEHLKMLNFLFTEIIFFIIMNVILFSFFDV